MVMVFQHLAVGLVMLCLLSPLAWSSQDEAEGFQLYFLSVETAIANLEHEHPAVRASAAKSIGLLGAYGKIGPEEARMAANALGSLLLDDEDLQVRRVAIGALGLMGAAAQAAVDDLARVLREDDSAEIREAAASLLGDMGPRAQAAVEDLIGSLMNDADDAVRRRAALALGAIGPAAGAAVDGLRSVLRKDPFIEIRINAAAALGNLGPAVRAAVEDLRKVLRGEYDDQGYFLLSLDDKRYGSASTPPFAPDYLYARLRHTALQSLGQIGPPAWTTAVSDLRKVILEDEAPEVRESAAGLLTGLGPTAQAAIDDLRYVLLNDKVAEVRAGAARALARMGPVAQVAMPDLLQAALHDGDPKVRRRAAATLADIATALRDAHATSALDELKSVHDALAASADPEITRAAATVRRAVEFLEQLWWVQRWKEVQDWAREHPVLALGAPVYLLWVLVWCVIFGLRPQTLLSINEALRALEAKLPYLETPIPVRFLLFVGLLNYRPRVLDAWVKARIDAVRGNFTRKDTVRNRQLHISVPVVLDGEIVPDPTASDFRPIFMRGLGCLLIWGEGGSGKTSLACLLGRWAMTEESQARLAPPLMIPLLIEDELPQALIDAIRRQLQDLTEEPEPPPPELVEQLLRQRRVLLIVDHLSELSAATRAKITPGSADFPANALVVTSRLEEKLGGVSKSVLKSQRIAGNYVSDFMGAYFSKCGKRELFTDPEFFEGCRRLSEMVGERDITVLLARLYAEQMIAAKEGGGDEELPSTIPDLMLSYLNKLNRAISEGRLEDRAVHRDVKTLAWACLRETLRPARIRVDSAIAALGGDDAEARLTYLEHRLRLIQTIQPAQQHIRFLLDPLAEYLAALHLVESYGADEEAWREFLVQAKAMPGAPEGVKGFLLALRDCCLARAADANVPPFVAAFALRGFDPEGGQNRHSRAYQADENGVGR